MLAMILAALLLTASCQSSSGSRSPLEAAKLAYVDASYVYDSANELIQSARASGQINLAQYARVEAARAQVRVYAPIVRKGLDTWTATGAKPPTLDADTFKLLSAYSDVNAVKAEVKP